MYSKTSPWNWLVPDRSHHVHHAARHAADLGGIAGNFHLELLHGAHIGPDLGGGAAGVAVVEAIHVEVRGVGAGAVDGCERALPALGAGITPGTRNARSVKSRPSSGRSLISCCTITSPLIAPFSVFNVATSAVSGHRLHSHCPA